MQVHIKPVRDFKGVSAAADKRAVSPVISTVIITATLLIILVVASSLAISMLEIQMQNSEFEQAKTAMLLLDRTIMDVSLRPGAASSVQFNQRSGGIGLYEGEALSIEIRSGSNSIWSKTINSYVVKYRGGSMVSAAKADLTDPGGLIVDMSRPLGHVRIESGNGAWIILEYNRVRITVNRELGTMDIYLIRLEPGVFGGSGTVNVRVQNKEIKVESKTLSGGGLTVRVEVGGLSREQDYSGISVVRVIEVTIMVSVA
ncbi:MAG: hypothetical protein QW241_07510 [Candidatus Bathyarchaeia archaeon]